MFYLDCFTELDKNFPVNSYYDEDPEKLAKAGAELLKIKNDINKNELIGRTLEEITRYYVEKTLKLTNGSREDASSILGIGERTIYRYIQSWKDQPIKPVEQPKISDIVEIRISKETKGNGTMFELFTDRARKVVQYAREEAYKQNFEYAGTEHILIGLLREPNGVGHHVLESLDISIGRIHCEIEKIVQRGPDFEVDRDKVVFTPRSKKVFEYAVDEARILGHKYVGTEHLLLGLLREKESISAQILLNLGVNINNTRTAVRELLGCKEQYQFEKVYSNSSELYNVLNGQREHIALFDKTNNKISAPQAVDLDELNKIIDVCREMK